MTTEFIRAQAECFRTTNCLCRHYSRCRKFTAPEQRHYDDGLTEPTTGECNGLCGCEDGSLCHEKVCGFPLLDNPIHRKIYVIGALKNDMIPEIAAKLREDLAFEVFDDWHAAHPQADNEWQNYERTRGRSYEQAIKEPAAQNVFQFDLRHLNESTHGLLILPAGRSGHLELGYLVGRGCYTAILLDGDYDRWDVMYGFADLVTRDLEEVIKLWAR